MERIKISNTLDKILAGYINVQKSDLSKILFDVQQEFGYLSEEVIKKVSGFTGVSTTEIYGYASFYSMYKLSKPGLHTIRICKGTACHVRGAKRLINEITDYLKIKPGETTPDGVFTLELSSCLGVCALAPVVMIDDQTFSRVKFKTIKPILDSYISGDNKDNAE